MATATAKTAQEKRARYTKRLASLRRVRSTWDAHWRELAEYISPRHFRLYSSTETNKGTKSRQRIVNNAAGWAARTLAAGMMAGITSPARPWFRLTIDDEALATDGGVKEWLALVAQAVLDAFSKSNIYKALHEMYGTLGIFGTAVIVLEEDRINALRAYTVPMGEFCVAMSDRGVVETLYHETSLSVEQLVDRFGYDACSRSVRELYDRTEYDTLVDVVHVIEPRKDYDSAKADPKNMAWSSCWYERGGDAGTGLLSEKGYNECPILAPRWSVIGNDTYGHSPGMDSLPDVKGLQRYEEDKALVIAKLADPPMVGPTDLLNREVSLLPGEVTYFDRVAGGHGLEPLVTPNPAAVGAIQGAIGETVNRINRDFYADLWLMLSQDDQAQPITAREVSERHEEKMLQLGPVLEALDKELLDPMVERTIGILARSGLLPPLPDVLRGKGKNIHPEYISIMAQAQKMIAAGSLTQFTGFVAQVFTTKPEVMDKVNTDKLVDEYADALGVNPELIVSDAKVAAVRGARAKANQAQAAQSNAMAAAQVAKTASQADTGGDNALTRSLGPVAGAQAGAQ